MKIMKINELFVQVTGEKDVLLDIYEHFSFKVPGYKFMPAYKYGSWDGFVRMFNLKNGKFPMGLVTDLMKFLKTNEVIYEIDKSIIPIDFKEELEKFEENIIPSLKMVPYNYQWDAFIKSIKLNRTLTLSPTGSGKSFIIYLIIRFLLEHTEEKILVSVPSINLVKQMHTDFCEYESDGVVCSQCYELSAGASKKTDKRVVISTWSMLLQCKPEFFNQFGSFICDESHQASSDALGKIISHLGHVKFRYGFTGTLDGSKTHEMQCRSWFGPLIKASTTKELMDRDILAPLEIKCMDIRYENEECQIVSHMKYQDEIQYIIAHKKRNFKLLELAMKQENNTLLLFNMVDKHGMKLFDEAKKMAESYGKQVHLIVGDVDGDSREEIRQLMEKNNNVVLFASFGTMSVGVNIKNLHNLILAHPFKARIRILQSIGRTLRKLSGDKKAIIYDIADNFCWKKSQNHTYKHSLDRIRIYESEGFDISFSTEYLTE